MTIIKLLNFVMEKFKLDCVSLPTQKHHKTWKNEKKTMENFQKPPSFIIIKNNVNGI